MALKWGIISSGHITNDFVSALRSLPENEHTIVSIAARQLSNAKKFAENHKITNAYGSYEELANDPNVEVVYIGTIHPHHLPVAKMMLNHGKHVLVEEPLTLNHKGSTELLKLAKEKGLFCMEGLWSRFLPSYEFVTEQLKKGVIGDVYHVNATFGKQSFHKEKNIRKSMGGGTLLNYGNYALNIIEMVYGNEMPLKIQSVGHLNDEGCDISVSASLLFSNRKTASISTHLYVQLPNEAFIVGTKGTIKIMYPFWCADKVFVNDKCYDFPLPETTLPFNFDNSSGLRYEAMEVRRCIRAGKLESERMPHKDSLRLAQIMDTINDQIGVKYDVEY